MHYILKLKNTRVIKVDRKRLKIVLAVLNAARRTFPKTNEFIDSGLKE